MKTVLFAAIYNGPDAKEPAGWSVTVDGDEIVCLRGNETDIADYALDPLWTALGVAVGFQEEER